MRIQRRRIQRNGEKIDGHGRVLENIGAENAES